MIIFLISAANSAVCYALEITAVDPVFYGLMFERFLAPERGEPPDIDIDIESFPTGMPMPRAGQRSMPMARTASYKRVPSPALDAAHMPCFLMFTRQIHELGAQYT